MMKTLPAGIGITTLVVWMPQWDDGALPVTTPPIGRSALYSPMKSR